MFRDSVGTMVAVGIWYAKNPIPRAVSSPFSRSETDSLVIESVHPWNFAPSVCYFELRL